MTGPHITVLTGASRGLGLAMAQQLLARGHRVLATRFGYHAAQLVKAAQFGKMVALQGDECVSVPLELVAGRVRHVPLDHELVRAARGIGVQLGA